MGERAFAVGSCVIGDGAPVFFVAEAGVNHNGDLGLALKLVDAAADGGADAVKFQTFRTDALVSRAAPKAGYQVETTGGAESQRDMLARLELTLADFARVQERCAKRGVGFFSAPFDDASAGALERLAAPLFKVPSGEITNLPFLRHVAAKRRPMIVSTGMSTLAEGGEAVAGLPAAGDPPVALLDCASPYPAPPDGMDPRA